MAYPAIAVKTTKADNLALAIVLYKLKSSEIVVSGRVLHLIAGFGSPFASLIAGCGIGMGDERGTRGEVEGGGKIGSRACLKEFSKKAKSEVLRGVGALGVVDKRSSWA